MKNETLYYKTVNLLLDAYNDRRLEHGSCTACAVGNICGGRSIWAYRFITTSAAGQIEDPTNLNLATEYKRFGLNPVEIVFNGPTKDQLEMFRNEADKVINETGYSKRELMKIEYAFERAALKDEEKETQYFGLCAVLDALRDIHETDSNSHEESQSKLTAIYKKLQPCV